MTSGTERRPLVIDASAIVDLLLGSDTGLEVADRLTSTTALYSVAHVDAEAFSALARLHRAEVLTADDVDDRLTLLATMPVERLPVAGALLHDAWRLRDRVAARDALYVAAAIRLGGRVLTTDHRLRRAAPELCLT